MLDRRNLLRSRSKLGRSRSALMGRQDYIREGDGRWRGAVSLFESSGSLNLPRTDAATTPRSYSSRLSERLKEKADHYYKLGVASFREGHYPRSQDYFKLVRQLEHDRPRAFVANIIVSVHEAEVNTAVMSLIHAIRRAESLADLKIDRTAFYAREQDFQRVVDSVNLMAKSGGGTNKMTNLMLAYFSFLNGDLITAISAAKVAEERARSGSPANVGSNLSPRPRREDPFAAAAKRFGELLVAARDQRGASDGGG